MTPSVTDKTPIPANIWRRHTDPPGLWISVVIGSVFLHLLVFWLMRSSNAFSVWFPQQSQSAISVELIDIAPKTKPTTKTVSAKPLSLTQKSVPARLSQTARITPGNQDFGAINSADNLQQKSRTYASQTNSQSFKQQKVTTPTQTSAPTATLVQTSRPTATPTPKPAIPVGNLPWNNRQEIKLGKGTALPTNIPSNQSVSKAENRETSATPARETPATPARETPATPARETPATPTRETSATPTRETSATPTRETSPTPTRETSPTSTEGGSVAIVESLRRDEVSNLIQSGKIRYDGLPEILASYTGSITKELDSSFLVQNSGLEPAHLLASLEVDNNGNFQKAFVIEMEPATLQSQKSTYEQVLSEVFRTENFTAAYNNDGTKPDSSYLYVRIKIQPANSN